MFGSKPPPLVAGPDGSIRVAGSRVSLETVVGAFDAGATAEEIAQQYPSLPLGAVYAVISYVIENRAAVDLYVAERRDAAGALRGEIEKQVSPDDLRAHVCGAKYGQMSGGTTGVNARTSLKPA